MTEEIGLILHNGLCSAPDFGEMSGKPDLHFHKVCITNYDHLSAMVAYNIVRCRDISLQRPRFRQDYSCFDKALIYQDAPYGGCFLKHSVLIN